jgi:tRNA nucleotidyltransferase (CCA-adding enzyme)
MNRPAGLLPDHLPQTVDVGASVTQILTQLESAGYETWCVGGAIRDALLGEPHQDVDLATAAPPEAVQQLFRRTVPVGIAHGTVGVLDDDNTLHEVTTFRRDVRTDGRHAVVEFGTSLDADLDRRDFTINAIAYHPIRRAWRDPHDGFGDLRRGVIRAVGEPAVRFREDRLRILRALRFAARWDFAVDDATWTAACAQAADTRELSAERVRDEWIKAIATARSVPQLVRTWIDSGVAQAWLPERRAVIGDDAVDDRDPVRVTARYCTRCAPVWRRFKGSSHEIQRAEAIDRGPSAPASADARDVRHWMSRVHDAAVDLHRLAQSHTPTAAWLRVYDVVVARGDPVDRAHLAVTGDDLAAAGIGRGPDMGRVLSRLLDAVIDDPALNTRQTLLSLAIGSLHHG